MNENVKKELRELVEDLYNQGYVCGITDEDYYDAYVLAVEKITKGRRFSDSLISECIDEVKLNED